MIRTTLFDVETQPQPREQLMASMPPFDPDSVAVGNLKPENAYAKVEKARQEHQHNWIDRAALDARTAQVKLVGFRQPDGWIQLNVWEESEETKDRLFEAFPDATVGAFDSESGLIGHSLFMLKTFCQESDDRVIGYNIVEFDLPMLFRRAWLLGLNERIPASWRRGRYWSDKFIDLRECWSFGDRQVSTGGLAGLAKLMGMEKQGDGKRFGELYQQDPVAALRYNLDELELQEQIARRMGVIA